VVVLGGHHLHSGADVVRHLQGAKLKIGRDLAVDEEPERIRAGHATAHEERSADQRSDRSRRCPRERSYRSGRNSARSDERSARLAARSRIEMSAIGSVYVVGKVRLSPTVNLDRGAGAGPSRGYCRGSLCRRAPPCPTWAMAAAGRSWVTTPIPVRPPDTTLAAGRSVGK
jgi:hypothetical protein